MAFESIGEVSKRVVCDSFTAARDRHIEEARKALDDWDKTRRLICLVRHGEHAEPPSGWPSLQHRWRRPVADADIITLSDVRHERTGREFPEPVRELTAPKRPAFVTREKFDSAKALFSDFVAALGGRKDEARAAALVRQRKLLTDWCDEALGMLDGDEAAVISLLQDRITAIKDRH